MTTTKGRFGAFGGQFVPETLMTPLHELEEAYEQDTARSDFPRGTRLLFKTIRWT